MLTVYEIDLTIPSRPPRIGDGEISANCRRAHAELFSDRAARAALASAAHSGEGPLTIRFADLRHRALPRRGF